MATAPRDRPDAGRPLFIVGAPRSGTTLVRALLAANPGISIPPESHFIGYLYRRYAGRVENWTPEASRSLARDIAADAHFRDWGLDPEAAADAVLATQPSSFAETVARFYRLYASQEGKDRWGDKTPHYLFAYAALDRLFPDLLLLHVVRDGRDVACSHLALARRGVRWLAHSAPDAAIWWRESIRHAWAAAAQLGPRFAEVRYEDLVAAPAETLRRVCAFVGLEYDDRMLEYQSTVRLPSEATHGPLFARAARGLQGAARDWRAELDARQVAAFEAVAGRELAACGYDRSGAVATPRERLAAQARAEIFWRRRSGGIAMRHVLHRHAAPLMRWHQRRRHAPPSPEA